MRRLKSDADSIGEWVDDDGQRYLGRGSGSRPPWRYYPFSNAAEREEARQAILLRLAPLSEILIPEFVDGELLIVGSLTGNKFKVVPETYMWDRTQLLKSELASFARK